MPDPFLTAFGDFARAEGQRDPTLSGPMLLLADALTRVVPAEMGPLASLPVVDKHLEASRQTGVGVPADLALQMVDRTSWASPYPDYAGEPDMDAMRSAYAYTPIIGQAESAILLTAGSAPYLSDEVSAGLVLQGPGVVYPPHVHKAVEIYWVISGTADWQRGDEWSTHGPGATIFHDTGVRHATTTGDGPQLLLFAWATDPGGVPVIVRF